MNETRMFLSEQGQLLEYSIWAAIHPLNEQLSAKMAYVTILDHHSQNLKITRYFPCIMHTCVYRTPRFWSLFSGIKRVSISFLTTNSFLEKYSSNVIFSSTSTKISYRSWCTLVNILPVRWYVKFYDAFFVSSLCCTIKCDHLHNNCNIFMSEESWNKLDLLAMWQDSRWHSREYSCDLFSFKSFRICSKNQKISSWVDQTFTKPKGKFFMEFTLIVIEILIWQQNATNFQSWS